MEAFDASECVQVLTGDTDVVEETVITEGVFPDSGDFCDLLGVLEDEQRVGVEERRDLAEVSDQFEELLKSILPLCEGNLLTCDKRNSGSVKQFLEVYNNTSLSPEFFNVKSRIILYFQEDDLHIKLLDGSNHVIKDVVCVGSWRTWDTDTRIHRFTSEISSFINLLKNCVQCPGAFYEEELVRRNISIPTAQSNSFLIEKVTADRFLYRSRQCPMTLQGTACHPCSLLNASVFFNSTAEVIPDAEVKEDSFDEFETVKEENHNDLSSEDSSCIKGESSSFANSSAKDHVLKPKFSTKKDWSKTPTYKSLLIEAFLNSPNGRLRLENIVDNLRLKYPELGSNLKKLENGIRCNLSIHKLFRRMGQPRSKDSYWVMDPVEYQKILDEEKQKEEEAKSFIDKRCQVALKQWNNLQLQQQKLKQKDLHREKEVVWVDVTRTQELRNAEKFLVQAKDQGRASQESIQMTPRFKVESSVKSKGSAKYRGCGRNLDELADRINRKAIENIKIKSESLDQEQLYTLHVEAGVDPFSQFGSQGYQYPENHHSQVTPQYQVSVPLVCGQVPETLIMPEAEIVKHEPSVPMMCGQPQGAQSAGKSVIIDGKKYRLNIVNNN